MRIARRRTNQGECVKPLAHAASGRRWMAPKKRRVPTNPAGGSAAWAAKRRSGAAAAASSTSNVNDDDDDDAPQDGSTNADGTGDDMSEGGGGLASVGEARLPSARHRPHPRPNPSIVVTSKWMPSPQIRSAWLAAVWWCRGKTHATRGSERRPACALWTATRLRPPMVLRTSCRGLATATSTT